MDRVLIAGISGSGKTTLARKLSVRWGLPHFELDALYHGPGWVKRPMFESDVRRFSSGPRWVTEDQYDWLLGDLLWDRADTVIWLDLPRRTVMLRVVRRSVVRAAMRRPLWNGNRERFWDWRRADHPIRWAWSQFHRRRARTVERATRVSGVTVIRLRTARQVSGWLADVGGG